MHAPSVVDTVAFTAWVIVCLCAVAVPAFYMIRTLHRRYWRPSNNPGSMRVFADDTTFYYNIKWAQNGVPHITTTRATNNTQHNMNADCTSTRDC